MLAAKGILALFPHVIFNFLAKRATPLDPSVADFLSSSSGTEKGEKGHLSYWQQDLVVGLDMYKHLYLYWLGQVLESANSA